jgi:hypothetical protein
MDGFCQYGMPHHIEQEASGLITFVIAAQVEQY